MDEKKKRLIFIGGILILLLILLLLFWPEKKDTQEEVVQTPSAEVSPREEVQLAPLVKRDVPTPSQARAESVARAFAERYGSFSAESDFANVRDLYPLMTASFAAEQSSQIEESASSDEYYGVTSKLLSLEFGSFTETGAVVNVGMQRVESRNSATETETFYETLRLELVFENSAWFVNGADWLKE